MTYLVLLFGLVISLGSVVMVFRPDLVIGFITKHSDTLGLHLFAVLIRVIFGVALVMGAAESKYPTVLLVFGWLLLLIAVILSLIGRARFKNLATWAVTLSPILQRFAAVFGFLLGCFLIYAVT